MPRWPPVWRDAIDVLIAVLSRIGPQARDAPVQDCLAGLQVLLLQHEQTRRPLQ
ncbi:hypothetical protein ACQZM9_34175 [Streptomyces sp. P11-1]|uniref:hypothetical protein n=1 Tax=Streptomyces sp. P11-1 TaxID=3423221 RepID=UPI003D2EAEB9